MGVAGRLVGLAAGAAGLAAAGLGVRIAQERRALASRQEAELVPLGSLRSTPLTLVTSDGVPLHVEVDEPEGKPGPLTIVFVHGYALNLDCWHFQRLAYRGLVRCVFYDQRSHGRSGRSRPEHATIDQLGADLRQIIDEVVPDGPVVLIGHSMGGMTIFALAEQHPELFGDRIVATGLISTTAGDLDVERLLLPFVPSNVGADLLRRGVTLLARGHRTIDSLRRVSRDIALVATNDLAFGDDVPEEFVEFVDRMLQETPFQVISEFFPNFSTLDKFAAAEALAEVPTTIVCGTSDKLTGIAHSRKLHALIAGSDLLECEGAGHLVILERHDQVNAALDQMVAAAQQGTR
mgnify:CR=1 FL=1